VSKTESTTVPTIGNSSVSTTESTPVPTTNPSRMYLFSQTQYRVKY
jgi:hypothetical protein